MNERTIAALARLNSSFYSGSAERFSRTRQAPWPGWSRVLETWSHPDAGSTMPEAPSILDAGCGNGRFGVLLDRVLEPPYSYLGVDSSVPLLDIARSTVADREGVELRFVMADLVDEGLDGKLGELRFDLIVVFGVLHHIPSLKARRSLLLRLGRRLAPGGLMALTMWQFAVPDRFRARFMSWEDYNRQAEEPLDLAELEEGDFLLRWEKTLCRYCHFADPQEAAGLAGSLGLDVVDHFRSDGELNDLNLYYLLRQTPASPGRGGSQLLSSAALKIRESG